ncbi:HFL312Wp [Eremothecium sinecaudum]|uniref:HFL312Wp n=1 Tax=Eremothecium sinecaudum TaxID=45286 RepID=A0A0X8HU77_9SACH|nr:HFL312Wp [Eremothecium sinecaudum]AMD21544.1 HFL312Wp [Eremothecium sinecaudum]
MSTNISRSSKRSLSSAISSFFRRFPEGTLGRSSEKSFDVDNEYENGAMMDCDTSSETVIKRTRHELENGSAVGEHRAQQRRRAETSKLAGQSPQLILYESDGNLRPPVLPILPAQRLRMLRYKQEIRRQQMQMIQLVPSSQDEVRVLTGTLGVSNQGERLQNTLRKSANLRDRPTSSLKKGRLWSSDFEYDLSEYDVLKKQKLNGSLALNITSESPKFEQQLSLKKHTSGFGTRGPRMLSSNLSTTQKKLLQGASSELVADSKDATKGSDKNVLYIKEDRSGGNAGGPSKQLPSIGFDFLSRKTPSQTTGDIDPTVDEDDKAEKKGSGSQIDVNDNKKDVELKDSLAKKSPSLAFNLGPASKPLFATPSKIETRPASDEGEERSKKRAHRSSSTTADDNDGKLPEKTKPTLVFGTTETEKSSASQVTPTVAQKPTFSFGSTLNSLGKSTTSGAPKDLNPVGLSSKPKLTFAAANDNSPKETKPGFAFGGSNGKSDLSSKPEFSFGGIKATSESDKKPAFTFGANTDKNEPPAKVAFSFGAASDKGKTESKPAFTFSNNSDEKKDLTPAPSFSFGAAKLPTQKEPSPKPISLFESNKVEGEKNSSPKPFSFSTTKSEVEANKTPSFSFGGALKEKKPASIEETSKDKFNPVAPQVTIAGASSLFNAAPSTTTPSTLTNGGTFSGFGNDNANSKSNTPSASAQGTVPSAKTGGFKFDLSNFKTNVPAGSNPPAFNLQNNQSNSSANAPSNTFGFTGGIASVPTAPQPQQASTTFSFGQPPPANNNFGFNSGSTTANSSPAFGTSTNIQPTTGFNFGNAANGISTPPVFSNSASPAAAPVPVSFHPSTSVNMNFGGATSGLNPAQIFGQQQNQPAAPTTGFGAAPTQLQAMQMPSGRRIARMRARRG